MDKLGWGLGIRMRPLLWMVLRVWLVSAKASMKRRGWKCSGALENWRGRLQIQKQTSLLYAGFGYH